MGAVGAVAVLALWAGAIARDESESESKSHRRSIGGCENFVGIVVFIVFIVEMGLSRCSSGELTKLLMNAA